MQAFAARAQAEIDRVGLRPGRLERAQVASSVTSSALPSSAAAASAVELGLERQVLDPFLGGQAQVGLDTGQAHGSDLDQRRVGNLAPRHEPDRAA